jgi:predicted ATPase
LGIENRHVPTYNPKDRFHVLTAASQHYVWVHDSVQQAVYESLTGREKRLLYSKIGKAFMHAIKPGDMKDLLFEVLALLNKGIDSEDLMQRQMIANLNLLFQKPF